MSVSDPVGDRFVDSIARPGGNVTGFTNLEAAVAGKWLELLKEVAPDTRRVAALFTRWPLRVMHRQDCALKISRRTQRELE